MTDPKVAVVVGAGFAGLNAAKKLANRENLRVILVDHRNHHLFQPLLYQVATAGLNPADIAVPIRVQFRHAENVEIHLGHVEGVNLERQTVFGEGHEIPFNYLILACGARHSYFGHPEWEEFAPGLKTLEQATEMRRRMLIAFERAENELDRDTQQAYLTFVVVGGGPTGVELAGAIADISRTAMRGDFRRIDPTKSHIVLVEAAPRVLTTFSEEISERARRDLVELGVEVRTNAKVEAIDGEGVTIGAQKLYARTVFWAAGVQAERLQIVPARRNGSGGAHQSEQRLLGAGPCECLRHRRHGRVRNRARQAAARRRTRCHSGRRTRRRNDSWRSRRRAAAPISVQRQRAVGDDRQEPRRGADWPPDAHGPNRVAHVAPRACLLADRIPESRRRALRLGLGYMFSKREARLITEKEWRLRN